MKKVFFTLALVAGFMTAQAQTDTKTKDTKKQPSTTKSTVGKDAKKGAQGSGSSVAPKSGSGSSSTTAPATPVTPADSTRKPEDKE